MERMTVSTEVLNKVLQVLGAMPYAQVASVVQELQQDAQPLESEATE
jgi:hypothetical protein